MGTLHHPNNMHVIHRVENLRKKDRDPREFYGERYESIIKDIKLKNKEKEDVYE